MGQAFRLRRPSRPPRGFASHDEAARRTAAGGTPAPHEAVTCGLAGSEAAIRSRTAPRAPDGPQDSFQSAIPIRKQVDIVDLIRHRARHLARLESHRHNEDCLQRQTPRAIERIPQLALKLPALGDRPRRKTSHKRIRDGDRSLNCPRPVLPGEKLLLVEPCAEAGAIQVFVQTMGKT